LEQKKLRKVEQRQKGDEGAGAGAYKIRERGGGKEVEQGRAGEEAAERGEAGVDEVGSRSRREIREEEQEQTK
jgi:hypothetical protein